MRCSLRGTWPSRSSKRGDYLLEIKGNQPTLKEAIEGLLEHPPWARAGEPRSMRRTVSVGKQGGRVEQRVLEASSVVQGYLDFPGLQQVCRLTYLRRQRGRESTEVTYPATHLAETRATARDLLGLRRGHWGIENRLHHVRDVTYDEDRSTVRSGALPQVLAALRNIALFLLRRTGATNMAAARRSKAAQIQRTFDLISLPSYF